MHMCVWLCLCGTRLFQGYVASRSLGNCVLGHVNGVCGRGSYGVLVGDQVCVCARARV